MTVDVVMPTYNRPAEILREAVMSALASPLVSRVIVIDDGSRAPAIDFLRGLDSRLEVLRQENSGPSAARNRGLDAATAPYVALMDDDDELVPASLPVMIQLAERFGASAVLGAREEFGDNKPVKPLPFPPDLIDRAWPDPRDVFRPMSALRGGAFISRKHGAEAVRFDPSLKLYEDKDYLYRCTKFGPTAGSSALAVRVRRWASGANLSSPQHADRRVVDHLAIAAKYPELADFPGWKEQARWLLNFYAKHGSNPALWARLRASAAASAVTPGLKASARWLARRVWPAG